MRSIPPRFALCLAALLLVTPLSRIFAADPAVDTLAPVAVLAPKATVDAPDTTPPAGTESIPAPAVTPTAVPAPVAVQLAPPPTPAPTPVADQGTLEAKMAVVLRSYTLIQEENDQLKAAAEKNSVEKSAIEAQLSVAKDALPVAAQVAGLREQLRQTQDQLAAMSLENNQLKTRLATLPPGPSTSNLAPTSVPTTLAPVVAPAPAGPRIHVVTAGETLSQIAVKYYGNASRWPDILAANRAVLKSEKSLLVGTKLSIP